MTAAILSCAVLALLIVLFATGLSLYKSQAANKTLSEGMRLLTANHAGRVQNFEKQVEDLRGSNTKLFNENAEWKRQVVETLRAKAEFLQKPVIDESNVTVLAQAIAQQIPLCGCKPRPN